MRQIGTTAALGMLVAAALASECGWGKAQAQGVTGVDARVVAKKIPGASAIAQVGTFINGRTLTSGDQTCANPSPIPLKFPTYTQPGAVLDPARLLVGSTSNFGAPLPASGGLRGSFLSIDPSGSATLVVPANFDSNGGPAAALDGAVQMFSANSPFWLNSVNNPSAVTAQAPFQDYAGVGNPLGLSNNNGFAGDNTIVRMQQDGSVVAIRRVPIQRPAARQCPVERNYRIRRCDRYYASDHDLRDLRRS
jgi:hypothetical protein